jgi:hypothetical protein
MSDLWFGWVLDIGHWDDERPAFAWCPYEEDGTIVLGLTLIAGVKAPGPMVGIFAESGQGTVDEWCASHPAVMAELKEANTSPFADAP